MAESSPSSDSPTKGKKVIIIGPSPEKNKPKSQDKGKELLTHDFHFKLQPSTKFRHAIGTLSNYHFNPSRFGLLEVDNSGLSITVYSESEPDWEEENVYGFLRLHADFFNQFECVNPVSKVICLERVLVSLSIGKDEWLLSVFSRHGSDLVTFAFEPIDKNEVPRGIPSNVELTNAMPDYPKFPEIIYVFEASILSSQLIPLITRILTLPPLLQPKFVTLDVQQASVRLTVGEKKVEEPDKKNELFFVWRYWETLLRAASTSEECSVYMVTEPPEHLMLLFKLTDPDDTITFSKGTYSCNKKVSCLAFLCAQT